MEYKVIRTCYFNNRLYEKGEIVTLEGSVPEHFSPLQEVAVISQEVTEEPLKVTVEPVEVTEEPKRRAARTKKEQI